MFIKRSIGVIFVLMTLLNNYLLSVYFNNNQQLDYFFFFPYTLYMLAKFQDTKK